MTDKKSHTTIDDVRQAAARAGIKMTKADYDAAARNAQKLTDDKQAAAAAQNKGRVERLLEATPALVRMIDNLSLVAFKLLQAIFSTFGLTLVLIAVVAVEIGRVRLGVAMFETSGAAAFAAAFVIVGLNITLEFLIHYSEHRANWQPPPRYAFSFRLVWQRLAYTLGFKDQWTPRKKSPAAGLRAFQLFLSIGILWLALMGSVGGMLNPDMVWHAALIDVFFYSQSGAFVVWMNGLIVSALLVFGSQRLTAYIAARAAESLPTSASGFDRAAYHEQAYAAELMARVSAKIATQAAPITAPITTTDAAPNGNGNGQHAPDFLAVTPNTPNYGGNGHKPE